MTSFAEDFAVAQIYDSQRRRVDAERIRSFAAELDPQPFHVDEDAAHAAARRGLAARGWHTAALTTRLLVASDLTSAGGIVGVRFDEFRWPCAARPASALRVESVVLGMRLANYCGPRANRVRTPNLNQHGEAVQVVASNLIVLNRKTQAHLD